MKNLFSAPLLDRDLFWRRIAILSWGITAFVVVLIFLISPEKVTGMDPYLKGAQRWTEGVDIYSSKPNKGFVYSPIAAVFFQAFNAIPKFLANIVWRLSGVALMLGGLWSVMRLGPFSQIPRRLEGLVFVLLLPLAVSNVDCGQANPHVIGLMMIGLAAAFQNRWLVAAIAVAGAVYWKVYPLTLGLLLILVAPWQFTVWLGLGLGILGFLPFLFQSQSYVIGQYKLWLTTRFMDNRLLYAIEIAPLDLWFVLVRVLGFPISELAYNLFRVATGGMIAIYCLIGRWKGWPRERVLCGLFCFLCAWIVLLGPATEAFTYLLLAPCVAIALVESQTLSLPLRFAACIAFGLFCLAVLHMGFFPRIKSPWLSIIQPVATLFYLAYALMRYLNEKDWKTSGLGNADKEAIALK